MQRTNLPHDLVVFQDSPACDELAMRHRRDRDHSNQGRGTKGGGLTDVNTVVVPVTTRHVLVDIGVDASHVCDDGAWVRATCWERVDVAGWWCRGQEGQAGQQSQ